jgi:site-specific DNA-methyltransferase (adenine-specific)
MLKINEVYNLDCFKFLKKVDNDVIDLAVIDPPYNMKKAEWDTFKSHNDFLKFTYKWIDALIPKIQDNGSLYNF